MGWFTDISLDGRDAKLCLLPVDWRTAPTTTLGFDTLMAEGLSGIEARASNYHSLRLTQVSFAYRLQLDAAEEFCAALKALGSKRLVLPIWPEHKAAADYEANKVFACQHWINFDPATGAYSLDAGSGKLRSVGLFSGRLMEQPTVSGRTDQEGTVTVRVQDDSPWASRVGIVAGTVYDWSLQPNWKSLPEEGTRTQQKLSRLGLGREQVVTLDDAPPKTTQKATFSVRDRERIRRLCRFFADKRGSWQAFTMPRWFRPGEDPGDVSYLNMKFAQDELELEWFTTDAIITDLAFEEVPVLDEGEPVQALASVAALYKFWWHDSSGSFTWTNWENDLVLGGVTYAASTIEHKAPTENLKPGTSDWEIMLRDFDGNPLRAFTLLALERRLHVEIRECDPTAVDATAVLRFAGEVSTASCKGKIYTATATLLGGALARLVPNYYVQKPCNHIFGDELCGVDLDDHKVVTAVSAVDGTTVDLAAGGDKADDYFALGYIEVGTGEDIELRFILRSASLGTGVRLTVHRPLRSHGAGADVNLFPGCDGQFEGGCARYANQDEFGGFPYIPAYFDSVSSGFKIQTGK